MVPEGSSESWHALSPAEIAVWDYWKKVVQEKRMSKRNAHKAARALCKYLEWSTGELQFIVASAGIVSLTRVALGQMVHLSPDVPLSSDIEASMLALPEDEVLVQDGQRVEAGQLLVRLASARQLGKERALEVATMAGQKFPTGT